MSRFIVIIVLVAQAASEKMLYWLPLKSGLFSHFVQMKIMYELSQHLNYHVVIVPSKSAHHYGEREINMCGIFNLSSSSGLSCGSVPNGIECDGNIVNVIDAQHSNICYNGGINFRLQYNTSGFIVRLQGSVRVIFFHCFPEPDQNPLPL